MVGRVRGACWLRAERPAGERAREAEGRDCSRAIVLSWWWREGLKGGRHRWWAASVRAACTLYTKMKEGSDGRTRVSLFTCAMQLKESFERLPLLLLVLFLHCHPSLFLVLARHRS